jgi:hypothetical protein
LAWLATLRWVASAGRLRAAGSARRQRAFTPLVALPSCLHGLVFKARSGGIDRRRNWLLHGRGPLVPPSTAGPIFFTFLYGQEGELGRFETNQPLESCRAYNYNNNGSNHLGTTPQAEDAAMKISLGARPLAAEGFRA